MQNRRTSKHGAIDEGNRRRMIVQQMKAKDDGTSVEQTKVNMVDSWRLDACAIWNCPSQFWSVMFCRDFYGFFSRISLSKVKTRRNR